MIKKILLIVCTYGMTSLAQAQIGISRLGQASPGYSATIGNGSVIGKTDLPVCEPQDVSCSIPAYVFTGNGYWNVETNWLGNLMPPQTLPTGEMIIINPIPGGECLLNIPQTINAGATLQIVPETRMKVLTSLTFLK
jgi:hypothetical protein